MAISVKEFLTRAYKLISSSSPTVPLHGSDLSEGLTILNSLIKQYGATGLLTPISQTETINVIPGQSIVTCGPSTYVPTPDITAGRLGTLENAWIELDGTAYPLIDKDRNVFLSSYRYSPLQGLPLWALTYFGTEITEIQLYPAPSQAYTFYVRGKFEKDALTSTDTLIGLPEYYVQFFYYAVARDLCFFKGRSEAWDQKLEGMYQEKRDVIESVSEVNLSIMDTGDVQLNGAHRVRAGI
jgi:hypothetical protein